MVREINAIIFRPCCEERQYKSSEVSRHIGTPSPSVLSPCKTGRTSLQTILIWFLRGYVEQIFPVAQVCEKYIDYAGRMCIGPFLYKVDEGIRKSRQRRHMKCVTIEWGGGG